MKTPLNKNQTILAFVILSIFAILVAAASWFYITQYAYPEEDYSSKVIKQEQDDVDDAAEVEDEESEPEPELSSDETYTVDKCRFRFTNPGYTPEVKSAHNATVAEVDFYSINGTYAAMCTSADLSLVKDYESVTFGSNTYRMVQNAPYITYHFSTMVNGAVEVLGMVVDKGMPESDVEKILTSLETF